ncbi:uncharacterized protein LOC132758898 [Ruditapes philippinarum]|uniref:uncharacterized protein LOC132758898 n=1 Tax=Ruditapes philippinarum TaxID=129788 RepID=UPI00295B166C|nr:uncharacterized protein LOC132758898 [Ruditapes philippinarum]
MASNFSGSLTQDSDEVKEMYCEECDRHSDGYATAVAFCVDCVDYLCVACQRYHERHFTTHKIHDSNNMPQEFYFEKCSTHPGQLVKFFCSECNKEACHECRNNEHVNCSDVNHLPTLASEIQESDELINIRKDINQLSKDIKDTEKVLDGKSELIKKQEENATDAIKEQSNKLVATYIQHHQDLIDDFDKTMEETIARLKKKRSELIQKVSEKERKFGEKVRKAETDMRENVVNTNTTFKLLMTEHLNLVGNLKALTVDLEQAQKLGQNYERMIRLITFSEEMEVLDTTEIPGQGCCFGIAYSNSHLVVSYYKLMLHDYLTIIRSSIKILSMSGKIVKSFDNGDYGQDLFNIPYYLTVSPDNTMIYVSDCGRNTVTCLTFDGEVKAIYKDDQLKNPHQLAVDEYGSVYVCGHDSNNVHLLSRDLSKVKILDKSHGIHTPSSIAYCLNTKKLFVGMNQSSIIKVFNVTLE